MIIWIMVTLKPCPKVVVASSTGPMVSSVNTREAVLASPARSMFVFRPKLKSSIYFNRVVFPIACPIFISATLQERSIAWEMVSTPSPYTLWHLMGLCPSATTRLPPQS